MDSQKKIDPYTILNVSKNCSKQELDISYQQTYSVLKRLPDQGAQIKLLKEAYKVVESDMQNTKQFDRLDQDRSFHRTDFTDYNNRQALFANDSLNFQEFEKKINNKKVTSTSYTPENVKGERLFEPGKFNINTFNKHFEENFSSIGGDTEVDTQGVDAFSSIAYMPICSYNGLIVEDSANSTTPGLQALKPLEPEASVPRQKKKNTKNKIKEEDIKKLYDKRRSESINVDTTRNFAEINRIMEQKQLENMKAQLEYNKNMIMKNISVFPQSIVDQFQMGVLEDSSTCIDNDSLVIPKGRRKE
jgi:hypothetical protein